MATLLLTLLILLLVVGGMAIGVIFGRQPIKGSCGGMSAMAGQTECVICGGSRERCDEVSGRSPPAGIESGVRKYDPRRDE